MQRKIATVPFVLAGAGVTITNLPPFDLSRSFENKSELIVTAAAAAAGDILDVKFQETEDGVQWNTRMRHTPQLGSSGATATSPESEVITILSLGPLSTADAIREPTGSKGATELTAPGKIDGFLTGRLGAGLPSYRVVMTVTSATAAAFTGVWFLWIDSDV